MAKQRDGGGREKWVGRAAGIGCLMAIPGFFGGGMVAVGLGRVVESFSGCVPPDGLPACHTFEYLLAGGLLGVILLPSVVVWRLRRVARAVRNSERS